MSFLLLIGGVIAAGFILMVVIEIVQMFKSVYCPKCKGTDHEESVLRPGILICKKCRTEHIMPTH